jgi:hypothetical protein
MSVNKFIAGLADAQAEHEDYTKPVEGAAFEKTLPVAGACVLRFREYIELGMQKTASKTYPNKKPAMKARFVFELTTPKHQFEVEDAEGSKTKHGHCISIVCPINKDVKANYMKLFKMMNYKGTAKVPAQLLGEAFKAEVVHAFDEKDMKDGKPVAGAAPKWANLQRDGVYTIEPPRIIDPLAETVTEIKVPPLLGDLKIFLWAMPTQECWDSLFIAGTSTKEIEGKKVEVSKNWIQNSILEALNYEGSKLQEMLQGAGETLADLPAGGPEEPAKEKSDLDALMGA